MNKFQKVVFPIVAISLGMGIFTVLPISAASSSSSTSSNTSPATIPSDIQTQILNSMQGYVTNHLPPDPTIPLSFACTSGNQQVCTSNSAAWQSFVNNIGSTQSTPTVQYNPTVQYDNQEPSQDSSSSSSSSSTSSGSVPLF